MLNNIEIHSTDTIYQIANIIKDLRNKKKQNQEDLDLKEEGVTYNEYWAILMLSQEKNYFVQICTIDGNTMYAELPNKYPDKYQISTEKIKTLHKLGWLEHTKQKRIQNYYRMFDVTDETACYATATEIILTMIKVFDYRTNEPIKVELDMWENDPSMAEKNTLIYKVKNIAKNILLLIAKQLDR